MIDNEKHIKTTKSHAHNTMTAILFKRLEKWEWLCWPIKCFWRSWLKSRLTAAVAFQTQQQEMKSFGAVAQFPLRAWFD